MSGGIRATVEFPSPVPCAIARIAGETNSVVDAVWTSVGSSGGPGSVSEFVIRADEAPSLDDVAHVISIGDRHLFRHDHADGEVCPCETLGRFGFAVQRYLAREGSLRLVFNARDFPELQGVMAALRDRFPGIDVRRLVRSPGEDGTEDAVFVDRGRLTDRQLGVLGTAYRMGYFDRPRGANATEVADALGIDQSTFAEHLAAAQRKLLGDVLEDGS